MSATVLYMSMSLDGFIAGPNAGAGNGLGDGGERLHEWLFKGQMPVFGQVFDEFMATGAIVGVTAYVIAKHQATERQRKIAGDWLAVKEGFALDGTRLLLHARRIGDFVVHGGLAQSLSIRRL